MGVTHADMIVNSNDRVFRKFMVRLIWALRTDSRPMLLIFALGATLGDGLNVMTTDG